MASPQLPPPPSRTYLSLDLWRGFAAVWVVLTHALETISRDAKPYPPQDAFARFSSWGGMGVQLFFVISGFCIAAAAANTLDRNQSVGKFMGARARRIFPPHWAALLLVLFWMLIAVFAQQRGFIQNSNLAAQWNMVTPGGVAANALLIQPFLRLPVLNPVSWTLTYEFAFYCVVAVMIAIAVRRGVPTLLKGLHVITLVSFVTFVFAPRWAFFPFSQWVCFGFGVLLFDLLYTTAFARRSPGEKLLYGGFIVTLAVLVAVLIMKTWYNGYSVSVGLAAFFTIMLYLCHPADAAIAGTKPLRPLFFAGTISYSLYLIHFPIIGIVHQGLKRFAIPTQWYMIEVIIIVTLSVFAAYLFYLAVESRFLSKRQLSPAKPNPVLEALPERA